MLRAFSTLEGVGKSLDPEYQFSTVAAPYAQELLQLQDAAGSAQGFVMEQLQQQATEVGAVHARQARRKPFQLKHSYSAVQHCANAPFIQGHGPLMHDAYNCIRVLVN